MVQKKKFIFSWPNYHKYYVLKPYLSCFELNCRRPLVVDNTLFSLTPTKFKISMFQSKSKRRTHPLLHPHTGAQMYTHACILVLEPAHNMYQ